MDSETQEVDGEMGILIKDGKAAFRTNGKQHIAQLIRHPHFEANVEESKTENGTIVELIGSMPAEDLCFRGWDD